MPPADEPLRIALAQINPTVGDLRGNSARIADSIDRAREAGAQLVVLPELALTGYPPEDLLLKSSFVAAAQGALADLAAGTSGVVALVGFPERDGALYNSAALLASGEVAGVYRKMRLPNYGVFDEQRYFRAGERPAVFELNGVRIGVTICEDIWAPGPPATHEALAGARVIVNLSASPYHAGKGLERERMIAERAAAAGATFAFCNLVGGQDELVFDGHSVVLADDGEVLARGAQFEEALVTCGVPAGSGASAADAAAAATLATLELPTPSRAEAGGGQLPPLMGAEEEVYGALTTGVRDYVDKNGFERAVVALSGGIDSALVALVAADALGADRLACISMPSRYSSEGTQADARAIAANLGSRLIEIPIEEPFLAFEGALRDEFSAVEPDLTEENLQARIRGTLVMALSNKFGWLVLTTGNKSELSVGYATLYGDMAGGFAVLKDVFKGWVYRLVAWRNERAERELVPGSVLERAPSAELRAEQRDDESLPPYDLLDAILEGYVEQDLDAAELVRRGLPEDEVDRVIRLVDRAEYKRRQAPPGIRISTKAFGRDRRLPITNRFAG